MTELILLFLTVGFCVVSWLYPWKSLSTRRGVIALQLPWAALATAILYEVVMRQKYNIRIDLVFIVPLGVVLGVITFSLYIRRMMQAARQWA
jgi:hypothetical protein